MFAKFDIVPRWVVLLIDLLIGYFAFLFSHFIKNNLSFQSVDLHTLSGNILVLLMMYSVSFIIFKTYDGIIRYFGLQDGLRIFYAIISVIAVLFFFSLFSTFLGGSLYFSAVILILNLFFSLIFLIAYRLLIKYLFNFFQYRKLEKRNVIICGAGDAGFATKRVLEHDYSSNIRIVAFLDDNPRKTNKVADGIRIYNINELESVVNNTKIDEIIIADFSLSLHKKNEIVEYCLENQIAVMIVPPVETWINGQFSSRQLQAIKIENLLEREAIKLDDKALREQINNKKILVTGAAGSIGSELVRQLLSYQPHSIILCDQAESPLFHLELELFSLNKSRTHCIPFLCDITNVKRMEELFAKYKPDFVYHAAAYKHVPLMEMSPAEAIRNNTYGTKVLADLSLKYQTKRFVMVSTDKAVNPTNIMGASKRLSEMYVQYMHVKLQNLHPESANPQTRFIITRFGNVLGTNGSVVSIFKEQIEKGGPVTVTHPEITRYFMTIPESCQLVLEAGSMGNGGEIFVFDMGKPVTIVSLAHKMIRLYNLIPGKDIEIIYTGLRPGEKLYEELWTGNEELKPTHHEKIMIAGYEKTLNNPKFSEQFDNLLKLALENGEDVHIVGVMKKLLPEFISKNSIFEKLDT